MEMLEAGGRLWVGAGDGRFLVAEPFADRTGEILHTEPLWGGSPGRLQAVVSGTWLAMHADQGVWSANLLALDEPHGNGLNPQSLWMAGPGKRLAAAPILLAAKPTHSTIDHHDRLLVWLTEESAETVLYLATLSLDPQKGPDVTAWPLGAEKHPGLGLAGKQCAVLLEASFGAAPGCLIVTRRGIWLIESLGAGVKYAPEHLVSQGSNLRVKTHQDDIPGVVFLKGGSARTQTVRPGRIFFLRRSRATSVAPTRSPLARAQSKPDRLQRLRRLASGRGGAGRNARRAVPGRSNPVAVRRPGPNESGGNQRLPP